MVIQRRVHLFLRPVCSACVRTLHNWPPGIYISSCFRIHYNLALEDYLYDNGVAGPLLLIYRNTPSVVIGRHQNVWAEVSATGVNDYRASVARRRSGGGTVYHDLHNLNISFFTSRKDYNRKENLNLIVQAILDIDPSLKVKATARDDIELDGLKISGTAAKLGRNVAYHHCTLLLRTDQTCMSALLKPSLTGIQSRASKSVKSPTTGLLEQSSELTYSKLLSSIVHRYSTDVLGDPTEVRYVDPTRVSALCPLYDEQRSWEHVYGATPKFTISRTFVGEHGVLTVKAEVVHGCVTQLDLLPTTKELNGEIVGKKIGEIDILQNIGNREQDEDNGWKKWVRACVVQTFHLK